QVSWNGMLAYLTMANLVIGVFNLIPAYPMDGGRILRALLAMKLDYGKATSIAVSVGQGLALLLGLWGFMSGTWTLVLIAILVWMGASHEGRHVEAKSVLQEFKVNQAMTRQPLTLKTDDTLARAVELTLSNAQADFPVVKDDKGELVGFLNEANLVKGLQAHGGNFQVSEMMQTDVFTTDVDEPLFTVQQRMASKRVQAAPVVDRDGRLVGLLTATDINQAYQLLSVHPQLAPQASTS
ncbi:MAG: CBS domain-containing protein, partial [Anaerolineales bacterium]